jgi:ParG
MTESPAGTIRLNINVDEKLHGAFKAVAALQGKRMTDLLLEFMEQYVHTHLPSGLPCKGGKK